MTEKKKYVQREGLIACSLCKNLCKYLNSGIYQCTVCGHLEYDNFGKIKKYLDEHGPTAAPIVSDETGVPLEAVTKLLRQGRIEIPEGSPAFIQCVNCGTDIRFGRYCVDCARSLSVKLQGAFMADEIGDKPKSKSGKPLEGKMRFVNREKNN